MITNLVVRALQSVKPHVPLIKFRKGSVAGHEAPQIAQVVAAAAPPQASAPKLNLKPVQAAPTLYDWQLPPKYRRQPLSQQELEFINRGGPE